MMMVGGCVRNCTKLRDVIDGLPLKIAHYKIIFGQRFANRNRPARNCRKRVVEPCPDQSD